VLSVIYGFLFNNSDLPMSYIGKDVEISDFYLYGFFTVVSLIIYRIVKVKTVAWIIVKGKK
jgi:hypothetical protein